ncbi:hypothetical protein RA19_08915 [Leisingera sp. ANG-M1]|uniref:hypothetical protein n=1 Tax=Leisingera sp. ANG-M1 TaxID=1577895 RepID=UPI00057D8EF0|nr:hypothetical protein [Leisingera sp. ANG-M1]KIC10858.1 hypothetical protein RA19_08915 [Leisingera sp. ANG-M1]
MTLSSHLARLRGQERDCRLAAFGDIGACIVLRKSSDADHPQEYLDELCHQARRGFGLLDAAAGEVQAGADDVLVLTPGEARVYVRAPDGSGDALLCVCSSVEAAQRLVTPARELLAVLAGEA